MNLTRNSARFITLYTSVASTPQENNVKCIRLSDKIIERIFNIIGENFEKNVLPAMANKTDCESETIKYLLEEEVLIRKVALNIVLHSAVREETRE